MLGLYAAVTRQFPDGTPEGGWFPEERLTLPQAIEFYTAGSAYAEFADTRKGRLKPGYLADLVVLSKNLFEIQPREILDHQASAHCRRLRQVSSYAGNADDLRALARPLCLRNLQSAICNLQFQVQ